MTAAFFFLAVSVVMWWSNLKAGKTAHKFVSLWLGWACVIVAIILAGQEVRS